MIDDNQENAVKEGWINDEELDIDNIDVSEMKTIELKEENTE